MLSLWSWQKSSMTSRASTPDPATPGAISLAKVTLVAWKALQAYFSASAVATVTVWTPVGANEKSSATVSAVVGSAVPTTTNGGS